MAGAFQVSGHCADVQVACVLNARWPEGSVHLFGSTANCLSVTNNNDIDVCLELPELPDEQASCRPLRSPLLPFPRWQHCATAGACRRVRSSVPRMSKACSVHGRQLTNVRVLAMVERSPADPRSPPACGPWQAKKSEVVEEMARVLEAAGMRDVLPLAKARVPVVKCINPETGTKVTSLDLLCHSSPDYFAERPATALCRAVVVAQSCCEFELQYLTDIGDGSARVHMFPVGQWTVCFMM